jgi:hypothetical protein
MENVGLFFGSSCCFSAGLFFFLGCKNSGNENYDKKIASLKFFLFFFKKKKIWEEIFSGNHQLSFFYQKSRAYFRTILFFFREWKDPRSENFG